MVTPARRSARVSSPSTVVFVNLHKCVIIVYLFAVLPLLDYRVKKV